MASRTAYEIKIPYLQIMDEVGKLDTKLAKGTLEDSEVVELYKWMSLSRHYDEIAFKLQRSGRMGTYPQNKGQEAGPAGAGWAIKQHAPGSWLVPCYRENIALFINGLPMEKILLHWMGDERGNQIPDDVNMLPISIPIGTHPLHAVGASWKLKYTGNPDKQVAITFFGDGATSEGDIHEALNFASALKTPTIFFCQNNRWAISVPIEKQMGSETVVQKACAYGMDAIQIDGNDIFSSYVAVRDAIKRAVEENKPTFIEAVTYRLGDHTTADDARRYRDEAELESWLKKDPLIRVRAYLESKKLWDDARQAEMDDENKKKVSEVVKNAEGIEAPTSDHFFDHMYAELPDELRTQRDTLRTSSMGQKPGQESLAQPAMSTN